MKEHNEVLVYITDNREKVISGNPLCIVEKDPTVREQMLVDFSRALRANVVRLKNGDDMIISES